MPQNSVLANMWDYARDVQDEWDLIVNFAYDWLPFYLTPFIRTPIAHLVSMGSSNDALDHAMTRISRQFPNTVGVHTRSQADSFPFGAKCLCLGGAVDLSLYSFCSQPEHALAWFGRISPEKGLEDAVAAAKATGFPLKIWGKVQDDDYWKKLCDDHQGTPFEYCGFLKTDELQQAVGRCRAFLMTHRWVEAFGNTAIEALACGVPVIAYRRGGPSEIVRDGETGFLVEPGSVPGLVEAIGRVDQIDRRNCRRQAEVEFSLGALGDRYMNWFHQILGAEAMTNGY